MIIKDLLEKLQNPENIKKWKENAKLELTKLAKSLSPTCGHDGNPHEEVVVCRCKAYTKNFSFLRTNKKSFRVYSEDGPFRFVVGSLPTPSYVRERNRM